MSNLPKTSKLSDTLVISRLLGGLWQIADMERDGKIMDLELAAHSMNGYIEKGITAFDMADHYGSAELITGIYQKLFGNTQEAQFLTKWVPEPGPSTPQLVRTAVEKSLDRLKISSIDLLQFHAWNYADPSWLDCLFWLQELKQEGLIKNLGVTNLDAAHLRIAVTSGIDLVSNQICYSVLDQRAAYEMSSVCEEFQVKILAFGTLAGGFLSEKWLGKSEPTELITWSQMKYKRFIEEAGGWTKFQQVLADLNDLAQDKKCSIANIATRFILQAPNVAGVIIGVRLGESDHIMDNLELYNLELSKEDVKAVQNALAPLGPIRGGCGDEYRKPPFLTASGDLSHHVSKMPLPYQVIEEPGKKRIFSGTIWEDIAGFSRAVMKGKQIHISGTTATLGNRVIGGQDPIAQTHFVIDKIEGALQSFGASLNDVVRTRVYVKNLDQWETIARVHGQRFGAIQPANTMVRADLVGDEYLVEIEADAELG